TVADRKWGCHQVTPDGSLVLRSRDYGTLRTWRIVNGKAATGPSLSLRNSFFGGAAFSPDGKTYAVEERLDRVTGRVIRLPLRAPATNKEVATLPPAHDIPSQLLFSPDGSRLVSRNGAGLACWAVVEPEKPARTCSNPSDKPFISMACHPEGK